MARSARGSPGGAPELHRADRRRVGGEAEDGLSTPVAGKRGQVLRSRTGGSPSDLDDLVAGGKVGM